VDTLEVLGTVICVFTLEMLFDVEVFCLFVIVIEEVEAVIPPVARAFGDFK
jgi:hypothetical protein